MHKFFILVVSLLFLYHPSVASAADTNNKQQQGVAVEFLQMKQSLDELIQQLKTQQQEVSEYQKLQTAISYLSFRSRTIEQMKAELRFKKERLDLLEERIERIKDDPDEWERLNKDFQSKDPNPSPDEPRLSERMIKRFSEVAERINSEIIALETEVQALMGELVTFESYVQQKLGLLNSR